MYLFQHRLSSPTARNECFDLIIKTCMNPTFFSSRVCFGVIVSSILQHRPSFHLLKTLKLICVVNHLIQTL